MIPKLLIIPDAHSHPEFDNDRFTALGNFIMAEKPDVIVCLGDFADMPSLSSFDKFKKSFEGRRYKRDIECTIDAQVKLFAALNEYNAKRRKFKEKQYKPKLIMIGGNHEARIETATNNNPELDGILSISDLKYKKFGWKEIPFREKYHLEGITFCHYLPSGLMGRPIGGINQARSLITKQHVSCVVGHSHIFDHAEQTIGDAAGTKIFGLSAGWYSHEEQRVGWNLDTMQLWWHGVVILEDVSDGYYDVLRGITQRKIMREYL